MRFLGALGGSGKRVLECKPTELYRWRARREPIKLLLPASATYTGPKSISEWLEKVLVQIADVYTISLTKR